VWRIWTADTGLRNQVSRTNFLLRGVKSFVVLSHEWVLSLRCEPRALRFSKTRRPFLLSRRKTFRLRPVRQSFQPEERATEPPDDALRQEALPVSALPSGDGSSWCFLFAVRRQTEPRKHKTRMCCFRSEQVGDVVARSHTSWAGIRYRKLSACHAGHR